MYACLDRTGQRGAHWFRYNAKPLGQPAVVGTQTDSIEDAITLAGHVMSIAQAQHTHKVVTKATPSVMLKTQAL